MVSHFLHVIFGIKILLDIFPKARAKFYFFIESVPYGQDKPDIYLPKKHFFIIIKPESILNTKEFEEYKKHVISLSPNNKYLSVLFNNEIPSEILKTKKFIKIKRFIKIKGFKKRKKQKV